MNPRSYRQKVATGTVSGVGGEDKFHFGTIPQAWFKIDIQEALQPDVALMYPVDAADQNTVKDAVGGNAVWDQKYMKATICRRDKQSSGF
jgi:hypothetical protein